MAQSEGVVIGGSQEGGRKSDQSREVTRRLKSRSASLEPLSPTQTTTQAPEERKSKPVPTVVIYMTRTIHENKS